MFVMSGTGIRRTVGLLLRKVNRSMGERKLRKAPRHVTHVYRRVCNKLSGRTSRRLRGRFRMRGGRVILRGSVAFCSVYRRRLVPFCNGTRVTCVPGNGIANLDGLTHAISICTEEPRVRRHLAIRVTSTLRHILTPGKVVIVLRTRRAYVAVHKVGGPKDGAIAAIAENRFGRGVRLRGRFLTVIGS